MKEEDDEALPGPAWNWGAPDPNYKKEKTELETLREKYPSKYMVTVYAYWVNECRHLPRRDQWLKLRAAHQNGIIKWIHGDSETYTRKVDLYLDALRGTYRQRTKKDRQDSPA
jgi:hypothetical protein